MVKINYQTVSLLLSITFFVGILGVQNCLYSSNGVCLPMDYNKFKDPKDFMLVNISLKIQQISKVDDFHSTVEFMAFLTLTWEDSRLIIAKDNNGATVNDTFRKKGTDFNEVGKFYLPEDWIEKLWIPDFDIVGLKEFKLVKFLKSYICK